MGTANLFALFASATLVMPVMAFDGAKQSAPRPTGVAELFEDDADGLLKVLTNPGDGPGQGQAESTNVFSGRTCLKITHYQRFQRHVPGWNYAIRADPKPGEYRYLRFAWRTDGGSCLMLQLHDATDWHIRYTAGANPFGWQTRLVADVAPGKWTLVTVDLFKDFGERTLKGIAFTMDGGAGFFDHVYLGRAKEDLDRIDATGLADKKITLEPADLELHWKDLTADEAQMRYRAFWALVADARQSMPFVKEKIAVPKVSTPEEKQIREWIRKLDSESFATRERATAELRKVVSRSASLLESALAEAPSVESRRRLEQLLSVGPNRDENRARRQLGLRILDEIEARQKERQR